MDDDTFSNALPPGTRVGPVVLDRAIGQGAWGIVYEGQHDTWGHVAVKEYFPTTYASRQTRGSVGSSAPQWQDAVRRGLERFAQEGRALKAIRHENVVPVYEFLEQDGAALLVMDFVEGRTLLNAYEAGQFQDAPSVMALGATLIDTLQAIHAKNVLHRDIAPDNIMIRPDGSPVLIDFGGAAAAIATATRSTQNVVKDGYSPPEQYDTSANPTFPIGPWSDVYATAAVLYRLAAGREPAVSNARLLAAGSKSSTDPLVSLASIAPAGYPKEWLAAVDSGLTLLPKDRPQSAIEWRKHFEKTVTARKVSPLLLGITAASLGVAVASAAVVFGPRLLHPGSSPTAVAIVSASPVASPPASPSARPSRKPVPKHVVQVPKAVPRPAVQPVQPPVVAGAAATPIVIYVTPQPPRATVPARAPTATPKKAPATTVPTPPDVVITAVPAIPAATATPTPRPTATPTPRPTATPTATPTPTPTPIALVPDACASGFVWRQASSTDHVCVTPVERSAAFAQNALAASRRSPTGGPSGPNTCISGYVWREAFSGDAVCVTPVERSTAALQNKLGPGRRAH